MGMDYKAYPISVQHKYKLNVATLLDNLLSQIACFDDAKLIFISSGGEFFDLIEQSPDSEDNDILFSCARISAGVSLSSLIDELMFKASDGLGDSLVRFDCHSDETWSLSFKTSDGEQVNVITSDEV